VSRRRILALSIALLALVALGAPGRAGAVREVDVVVNVRNEYDVALNAGVRGVYANSEVLVMPGEVRQLSWLLPVSGHNGQGVFSQAFQVGECAFRLTVEVDNTNGVQAWFQPPSAYAADVEGPGYECFIDPVKVLPEDAAGRVSVEFTVRVYRAGYYRPIKA